MTTTNHGNQIPSPAPKDWRVGRRVAVKYRTDSRYGTTGEVVAAAGDRLTIRLRSGVLIEDYEDSWRTA